MTLIAVDLGNTRLKFGLFSSRPAGLPEPDQVWTELPDSVRLRARIAEIRALALRGPITWCVARTNLHWWELLQESISGSFDPSEERSKPDEVIVELTWRDVPLRLDVESPDAVGIDRILAAYGALLLRQNRLDNTSEVNLRSFIVDAGSAITVDLISGDGLFAGGAILPGLNAQSEALASISARLPRLSTTGLDFSVFPGKNTEEALAAGIYWGTIGAITQLHYLVCDTLRQSNLCDQVPILLTGGDAPLLQNGLNQSLPNAHLVEYVPHLVLQAIAAVSERRAARQNMNDSASE